MKKFFCLAILVAAGQTCMRAQSTSNQLGTGYPREVPMNEDGANAAPVYLRSADNWEATVIVNPSDENAWLNLYKAERFGALGEQDRSLSTSARAKLDKLVIQISQNVPGSFADHYVRYFQLGKTTEGLVHLKEAARLRPDESELYDDLFFAALVEGDAAGMKLYASRLAAGIYPAPVLEYNRNVLNSIEQGAVLVTYGNFDTYPLFVLQQVYGFRTDVRVICLEWITHPGYRSMAEQSLGKSGILSANESESLASISATEGAAVYLSLAIPPDMLFRDERRLFCTGLVFRYSVLPVTNLASLDYNWNTLFSFDHTQSGDAINRNYLVPLAELWEHYQQSGNTARAEEIKAMALQIAAVHGITDTVAPLFR